MLLLLGAIVFFSSLWLMYLALGTSSNILLLAFAAAYLVHPVVVWLERKKIPRSVAVLSSILLLTGGLVGLGFLLVPLIYQELKAFIIALPSIFHSLVLKFNELAIRFHLPWSANEQDLLELLRKKFSENLQDLLKTLFSTASAVLSSGLGIILFLVQLALLPVFFYYLIAYYEETLKTAIDLVPKNYRRKTEAYLKRFNDVFSGFIRGQLIDCSALAAMYGLGLMLSGVQFGLTVGVISGFLSIIPYVGTAVGLVAACLLALSYSAEWTQYLGIVLTFSIGQAIESFIIQTKIVGQRVGLGPLSTLLILIAGGNIGGAAGIVLAIPIGAILKIILEDLLRIYKQSRLYQARD